MNESSSPVHPIEDRLAQLDQIIASDASVDLHSHSRHSDGDWTPSSLLADAAELGLSLLSLTDHDTVSGQAEAARAAAERGILFVSGMEVSLLVEGRAFHVLCYDFDPASPTWEEFTRLRRERRERYCLGLFEQLAGHGYAVSPDLARDEDGQFFPDPLAIALQRAGRAATIEAARTIVRGLALRFEAEAMYQEIHEFAGLLRPGEAIFSVAHPARQQAGVSVRLNETDLHRIAEAIPLVALEATHPYHSASDVTNYANLAAQHGLAVTCGSDAHGLRYQRPLRRHPAGLCGAFLRTIRERWATRTAPVLIRA